MWKPVPAESTLLHTFAQGPWAYEIRLIRDCFYIYGEQESYLDHNTVMYAVDWLAANNFQGILCIDDSVSQTGIAFWADKTRRTIHVKKV